MKLHKRFFIVEKAKSELATKIAEVVDKSGLTVLEIVGLLVHETASWHKYAMRRERHPKNPGKKADEE